jgi:glycosyltransferase involved in cell wall biosynthesis
MQEEKWAFVREAVGTGRLSVIMPIFNLQDSIADNLEKTASLFASYNIRTELVPVDDGSTDLSWSEIQKAAEKIGSSEIQCVVCKSVHLAQNGGKGAALKAGFDASSGEYVLLLDGDLDINPSQTPHFFEAMRLENADIVVGSKRHPDSKVQYPWHRRIVSWVYFSLVRWFVGIRITDTQSGMLRAYSQQGGKTIPLFQKTCRHQVPSSHRTFDS